MILRRALWLLPLALFAPAMTHAQAPSEMAVKAAYLVKFGAYVTWLQPRGMMTLCAVGRDVFGAALDRAADGQQIEGRAIAVRRMESVDVASSCDIAFLAGSPRQSIAAALSALRGAPVLTVTDSRWTSARGMIHFQVASDRVRFHIDEQAAAQARLEISSKLLGLALSVRARAK